MTAPIHHRRCRTVKFLLITANSLVTAAPITIPAATLLRRNRMVKRLPVTVVHPVTAVPTPTRHLRNRTAKNGGMFYTTNTESTFILNDVDITYADDNGFFLRCTGNNNQRGWGSSGSNGADCKFTAIDQDMEGDVIWDSISQLDFYMTGESTLTSLYCAGTITDASGKTVTIVGTVYVQGTSSYTITVDSYSTSVDTSDAESTTSFSDYAVTQP